MNRAGHDTRERLLAAAQRLVWGSSYGAVGIDAICREADVHKGSFYHFFPSKAELVAASLEAYGERIRPAFDDAFSATRSPLERLSKWFRLVEQGQVAERKTHGRTVGCPFTSAGSELATDDPELAGRVRELLDRNDRYLEQAIRDAQARGLARTDLRATELAAAMSTFLTGVMVQARILDDPHVATKLEEGARLILGIRKKRARREK